MRRGPLHIVAIALLGLVLALALGAFAHAIARDTVALPATTLSSADERLAPEGAKRAEPVATTREKARKVPTRKAGTTTKTATTPTTSTRTTTSEDNDSSGRGRGRGRGSDDSSGSGSGSSGSGSDNSGKGGDDD